MVSRPVKYGKPFFTKKAFRGGQALRANFWRFVLHGGTNDQIIQEGESFINTFSSNLNIVSL